ncbi:MAG: hypothetical protein WCI75_19545, partial [candidate division NC10 bacterium]
ARALCCEGRTSTMNIRKIAQIDPSYFEINREERNYAAIFFAALCRPGNTERFLRHRGIDSRVGPEFGIYFEYAYLRDLWNEITNEDTKKEIIRQHLPIQGIDEILRRPVKEINEKFGVAGKASSEFVQCPAKWSIRKYDDSFPDRNDEFLRICKFKWSFNIKPDIVIHLDKNHAVCIEAKYESGEGSYPSSGQEKRIFQRRSLDPVRQMELQKYMMEVILGLQTQFVFLVCGKKKSNTHEVVSWAEVFHCLDMSEMPAFAMHMVKGISASAR